MIKYVYWYTVYLLLKLTADLCWNDFRHSIGLRMWIWK